MNILKRLLKLFSSHSGEKNTKTIIKNFNKKFPFPVDSKKIQIAVITPIKKGDYITNTVLDGLVDLQESGELIDFYITEDYPIPFENSIKKLSDEDFFSYAKLANIILFMRCDGGHTRYDLAGQINEYKKTIYFDGSELKHNNRLDHRIQKELLDGQYQNTGKIDKEMLEKCALYFRREKPYINGIIPFPYGIESRYLSQYDPKIKKDIDFVCIFGQEEYPPMRKYCREILENFCKKNNFSCVTSKTDGFTFEDSKTAGREDFYSLLARAKVGISVSGGGSDTARFWETLANNCLLLTEAVDVYQIDSKKLDYQRIWEFSNLFDFQYQLEKIGYFLKKEYNQTKMEEEYNKIMSEHSSKSRVLEVINETRKIGLINKPLN